MPAVKRQRKKSGNNINSIKYVYVLKRLFELKETLKP